MEQQDGRQAIPFSIEAEKSVLGSMMLSREAVDLAAETLGEDDFYLAQHRRIFSAMAAIQKKNGVVDVVTLMEELDRLGQTENVGGIEYITELSLFTPASANVQYYIKIVEERSIMRRLMFAGSEITKDASEGKKEIEAMLDDAERRIFNISMRKNADTLLPIQATVHESYSRIGEMMLLKGSITGVPTGFADLDKLTSGMQKSDLVIVAGRPSMGKTALALNIASNAALRGNKTVVIFSLEMSREQLVIRLMSSEALVDMQALRRGETGEDELIRLAETLLPLSDAKIFIDDTANISVAEIRSKCRRLKARSGLDMVVIDYLQLMKTKKGGDNRVQEISELTRSLKILARELDVPILLLSQLSRAAHKVKPTMAHLRESGSIEQDADIVMLIYRAAVYEETDDNTAEIILAKHRNGPTGTVELIWRGEYTRFDNKAVEDREF